MTIKTFTARGKSSAWGRDTGNELTLFGSFFGYKTAKTFRDVKYLVLCEQEPSKQQQQRYGKEYWFVATDKAVIDRTAELFESPLKDFQRPGVIIQGKGKIVSSITPYMGCTAE